MKVLAVYKWPIVIFLLGSLLRIAGSLMKILHWSGADYMLIFSTAIMAIGIIFAIVKLLLVKKEKEKAPVKNDIPANS